MSKNPTWALFAPASAARLNEYLRRGAPSRPLQLKRGRGRYSALLDYGPGTEHSGEREIAAVLSKEGATYVAYFDPPWITTFERGAIKHDAEGDPHALARRLDCPVSDESTLRRRPAIDPGEETHVLLVVTTAAHEIARYYRTPWPLPADSELVIRETARGYVVTDRGGDLFTRSPALSEDLGVRVYAMKIQRSDGDVTSVRCRVFENGERVGSFDDPHTEWSEPDTLEEVLGERKAGAILSSLGL